MTKKWEFRGRPYRGRNIWSKIIVLVIIWVFVCTPVTDVIGQTTKDATTDKEQNASSNFISKGDKGTTTIFYENFEGAWPGSWNVGDSDSNSGYDYWGDNSYRAYAGSWSGYCADVGDTGANHKYDNNMISVMWRTFDISGYSSATLKYHYWLDCEAYCDKLEVLYYASSQWQTAKSYSGNYGSNGWVYDSISVPVSATGVKFRFSSDSSVTYEGAYLDEIYLEAITLSNPTITGYSLSPTTAG
ncbi:MAG: hypothetical protein QMC80_07330, partial [Thermoplasmatales archaeon]|nr:hypothetical protein [Thermoplasmatales archaeon]